MTSLKSSKAYKGLERRAITKRRIGVERRNLVRYEAIGSNRRIHSIRRKEDTFWQKHSS